MSSATKVVVIFWCLLASSVSASSDSKLIRRDQSESSKQAAVPKEDGVVAAVSIKPHALEVSAQANLLGKSTQSTDTDTTGPVAEALREAKAEFVALKEAEIRAKASSINTIAAAESRRKSHQTELDNTRWWHFWRWSLWSNFESDRKSWIASEKKTKETYSTIRDNQQAEIERLQGLVDNTHKFAGVSEGLETSITSLTKDISDMTKVKDDTITTHTAHRDQKTDEHDAAVQVFTDLIADKTSLMQTAQTEKDSLADSTHDLSTKLQELIVTQTKIIVGHQGAITDLAALIEQDQIEIDAEQLAKNLSVEASDAALKTLAEQKDKLDTDKAAAEASKKAAEEDLEKETSDGAAAVTNLKDELSTSISGLVQERTTAEGDRSTTIGTNADALKAMEDLHSGAVNTLKADQESTQNTQKLAGDAVVQTFADLIAKLSTSIDTAQTELDSLTASAFAAAGSAASASSGSNGTADSGSLLQKSQLKQPTHTLVQKIEDAKTAIRVTIATHQQTIERLQASLATNAQDTTSADATKKQNIKDYDAAILILTNSKAQLTASKTSTIAAKKSVEDVLATEKADREQSIEDLKQKLTDTIVGLETEKTKGEADRKDKVEANAAAMQSTVNEQNQIITDFEAQIALLEGQKTCATNSLNAIKAAHGVF